MARCYANAARAGGAPGRAAEAGGSGEVCGPREVGFAEGGRRRGGPRSFVRCGSRSRGCRTAGAAKGEAPAGAGTVAGDAGAVGGAFGTGGKAAATAALLDDVHSSFNLERRVIDVHHPRDANLGEDTCRVRRAAPCRDMPRSRLENNLGHDPERLAPARMIVY